MAPPQRPPDFARLPSGAPTGLEHVGPADTLEYDYGWMLEGAANAKCLATLERFRP
jgi:hypothetical protein